MPAKKYTYRIECSYGERWIKIIQNSTRDYCRGYLHARMESAPRPHYRLIRSDEVIIDDIPEVQDVQIGMIAGWPTAEQYERAAEKALAKAAAIRKRENTR